MIEVKGVIVYYEGKVKCCKVVVAVDNKPPFNSHYTGKDIKVDKGKIILFLSELYDVPSTDIVWPDHIILGDGDIELVAAL